MATAGPSASAVRTTASPGTTDGTLFEVPTPWDFSHIEGEEFRLPEAKVGTWAGFVFINMALDCEPLEDYLGVLPEHFAQWDFHKRRKAAHVAKVIPCNWKVGLEAFSRGPARGRSAPGSAALYR